jgi:LDH2 family malate/lactate/ureidoglycolate dehydrogenase
MFLKIVSEYCGLALKKDFIGYTVSNSAPMMAPWGGRDRIIGNNPVSYAFPANKYLPIVLDFSCSVVSSGKLILSRKKGEKIPLGFRNIPPFVSSLRVMPSKVDFLIEKKVK